MKKLEKYKVPDKILKRLKSLQNQEFTEEKKFLDAIGVQIGEEHKKRYQKLILTYARTSRLDNSYRRVVRF